MPNQSITIIGAGSWGTALSIHLANIGSRVNLWVYEKFLCEQIKETKENSEFLPGFTLPNLIHPTNSLEEAIGENDIILLVVPTNFIRNISKELSTFLKPSSIIVNAGKGIETASLCRIQEILKETLTNTSFFATLSGPTFAMEVAKGKPSAIVVASENKDISDQVQSIFSTPSLKVFTSDDPIGVEVGGALKNIMAITTGISDGVKFGHNARAAIITRGLVEISRIGTALGAKPETFFGLSGLGDLVLTCTGELSRNRQFGIRVGQGEHPQDIANDMKVAVEGLLTLKSAYALKSKLNIQASIIDETYKVIYEGKSPHQALKDLMQIKTTSEFIGVKGI
jgi:glycerol-3-phosphate dehydrogenase (NAD(P)+)